MTDTERILSDLRSARKKKVLLDTDTFNEIDDQFALAYLALAADRAELLSVNAAPFYGNGNSTSPEEGMEASYREILKIFDMMKITDIPVYRGSKKYLDDEKTPEITDAANNIIKTAHSMPEGELLYVVAIGAITNVASALIIDPTIAEKIAVIWLGGHALHINSTREFNMIQDIPAARVVFDKTKYFVMVPCLGMCTVLTLTTPELEACIGGKNKLCDYLCDNVTRCFGGDPFGRSRVIWDAVAAAVILLPSALDIVTLPTPIVTHDGVYAEDVRRKPMLYVRSLNRDMIVRDMFKHYLTCN